MVDVMLMSMEMEETLAGALLASWSSSPLLLLLTASVAASSFLLDFLLALFFNE
jgi:hypothetical protein